MKKEFLPKKQKNGKQHNILDFIFYFFHLSFVYLVSVSLLNDGVLQKRIKQIKYYLVCKKTLSIY